MKKGGHLVKYMTTTLHVLFCTFLLKKKCDKIAQVSNSFLSKYQCICKIINHLIFSKMLTNNIINFKKLDPWLLFELN